MSNLINGTTNLALAPTLQDKQRLFVHCQPIQPQDATAELLAGLAQPPRSIAPKFFYDSHGAQLFDRITQLPEYYLTRVERQVFVEHSADMAAAIGMNRILIEPGSGSSEKVELLLDTLQPSAYVAIDITESHLLRAAKRLVGRYPWLQVHAVCADYSDGIDLPQELPDAPRIVFFPGSTIGNFEPAAARDFLGHMRQACGNDGALLIGVDQPKHPRILNAAYNDSEEITASFNLNILNHVNVLADGDFNVANFRHLAYFDSIQSRIEMHLESLCAQTVTLAGETFDIAPGERIHTENSYKYSDEAFHSLAEEAGFRHHTTWKDPQNWFSVHLLDAV